MAREEEIERASKEFARNKEYYFVFDVQDAFENGAKWADKNPNIASLWHDASEEPRYEEFLLAEESNEFNVYKLSGQEDNNSWELLVSAMGIIRWAYISDLLPRQFGNSEQLKGGEK